MIYLVMISAITIVGLAGACFWMLKKMNEMRVQIKTLIKENDVPKTVCESTNEDITFKTDKNLIINTANDALYRELGFTKDEIIGKSIFGTILEDNEAYIDNVKNYTNKIIKKTNIVNNELVILKSDGKKQLVLCHQRPILNEILECEGISFVCKNISEASELREKLDEIKNKDALTDTLNQKAFMVRLEQDFLRAKRYNKEFALVVVELRDLCDFINKGISFEAGDKLLKTMTGFCSAKIKGFGSIGRFDKTKLGLILNDCSREKAAELAYDLFENSKPKIRKLGVDEYNAQMLIISYTERRGFNDTYDNMLERVNRHLKAAVRDHRYGVTASDIAIKKKSAVSKYEE